MKTTRTLRTALKLIVFLLAITALVPVARAQATYTKANNTDNLNLTSSWLTGIVPTSTDIALWDSNVLAANTTVLGGNLTWKGIQITNPTGLVTINAGNTLTLGSSGIEASTNTTGMTMNALLTLNAPQTWSFNSAVVNRFYGTTIDNGGNMLTINDGEVRIAGNLTGAGGLTKTGSSIASVVYFTGTNNYSGTTAIENGTTVSIGNNSATGSILSSSLITSATTGVMQFYRSNDFTFANTISGGITLRKYGAATTTLTGANTNTGATAIFGGTLSVSSLNSVVGGTASSNLGAPVDITKGTILLGSTTTAGQLTYTGSGETTDRVVGLNGTTGGATIDQSGTGLLKFTSATTATGLGNKTLTLQGSTAGTGEIAGAIVDNSGTNKTSLTKSGTGAWTLSGVNTYTGNTTVSVGTLLVNTAVSGSNSGTGGGSVSVSAAGTLGGTGQITPGAGAGITVASGGTIAPGTIALGASIGTLSLNGANTAATVLSLTSGATFAFELNTGLQSDRIALLNGAAGDIAFGGNAINFSDLSGGSLASGAYTLFTATAANNYGGTFAVDGSGFVTAGLSIGTGLGAYTGSTLQLVGNNIVLNVVPEPATWALIAGAGTFFMVMRRRNKGPLF